MLGRLPRVVKRAMRRAARGMGLEVCRLQHSPAYTLCGLRNLDVRTVVDVGANTGQFARQALEWFPRAQIVSFEPVSEAFEELGRLAKESRGRVRAEQVALGEQEGTLAMKVHLDHSPSSSLLDVTQRGLELYPFQRRRVERQVRVARLDDYLREREIELRPEVLVKLDVQGYEDRVIRGGKETLARAAACIVEISLEPLYVGQPTFREIVELLEALGLRYAGNLEQSFGPAGQVVFVDAVFLSRRVVL